MSRYPRVEIELAIPNELRQASKWCEVWCEAACCGETAFDLDPENLADWARDTSAEHVALVLRQADDLIAELVRLGPTAGLIWFSGEDPQGPKSWVEDLRECIIEATNPPQQLPDGTPIVRRISAKVRVLTKNTYLGKDYWSKPLETGRVSIVLPDRALQVELELRNNPLPPGEESLAELRFPLPSRIQRWLTPALTLDIGSSPEHKSAEARMIAAII
jgi:hypothetical protein